jgi:RNA polymerase sigma-70 factor (ECF subfamily)
MHASAVICGTAPVASEPFEAIVRRREAQVVRTAFRMLGNWADAEDVAQEAFLRLHRHGTRFPDEAALGSWLYRVTVNLCFDRTRAAKPAAEMPELRAQGISAESNVIREQAKEKLMAALAMLPAKERAAVVLREIEGLTTMEVAEVLGSSEVTVRSQISRALGRLRGMLRREEV